MGKLKEWIDKAEKLSSRKKAQYILIVILLAVILAIYFSTLAQPRENTGGTDAARAAVAGSDLEDRMEKALSAVDGAGDVEVVINYESSGVQVPAMSENTEVSTSTEEGSTKEMRSTKTEVIKSDGNEALIVKEELPEVRGVLIVAEGAGNIGVKMKLLEAAKTLLGVSADKVEVFKKES